MNVTVRLLTEYGKWLRVQTGVPYYVSPAFSLIKNNVADSSVQPFITDELAMFIDHLVSRLYKRYPDAGTALWNYYRYEGMTTRKLARLMRVSLAKVQELLKVSEAWIDSALENCKDAA